MITVTLVGCGMSSEQQPAPTSSPSTVPQSAPVSTDSPSDASSSSLSPTIVAVERERSAEELWALLQQAEEVSYVVLMRHAIAPGTGDPANFQLEDCSTQRNLSEEGRQQARQIGEAFRSRNVPITRVLSSQWCRCLETAELLNLGEVEPFPPLNSFFGNQSTAAAQTAEVQQFLLNHQETPGVMVMVSHQVNVTALSNIFPQSGEAVVMQIGDDNQLMILGRLLPE
jgi:phosphohistidine phosphatase SixA